MEHLNETSSQTTIAADCLKHIGACIIFCIHWSVYWGWKKSI